MKNFVQFLKENKLDENMGLDGNEKYFRFDESGKVDGMEDITEEEIRTIMEEIETEQNSDLELDWQDIPEFFENEGESLALEGKTEDGDYGKKGTTFGDETIIDCDLLGDDEGNEQLEEAAEKSTVTLDYLKNRTVNGIDDVKKDAFQYKIEPEDGNPGDDGKVVISRRKYTDPEDTRRPITDEEAQEIVDRKNTPPPPPKQFSFDEQGNFLSNGKKLSRNHKIGFLKKLNTLIDKINSKLLNGEKVHYKWEKIGDIQTDKDGNEIKGSEFGDRLMKNVSPWDDSNQDDQRRFDTAEYDFLSKEDQEELISKINKIQKAVKSKGTYGWNGWTFTLNDKPLLGKQLLKFVEVMNSHMSNDRTQEGWRKQKGSYWQHFKISMQGSKVGDVANFSLPPVVTCNRDAPCIDDGCYAVKASGMYPTTRIAQEVNLALLKEQGGYEKLKREIGAVLQNEKSPFQYFRFFVSGDCFSKDMLNCICEIASENGGVKFWMYTKQYALLHSFERSIPNNLTILVSCWGEFCPKLYKEGKFASLEEKFPLAYLDDGTENTQKYFKKKEGDVVCPCTEDDEVVAQCDKCHKCFDASSKSGNIIFRKH